MSLSHLKSDAIHAYCTYCGNILWHFFCFYVRVLHHYIELRWVLQKTNHQNMHFFGPPPHHSDLWIPVGWVKADISPVWPLLLIISGSTHYGRSWHCGCLWSWAFRLVFSGRLCFRPHLVSAWIVAVFVIFRGNTTTMSCETSTTRWSDNSHIVVLTKLFGGDSCNIGCIPRSQHLASKICH